MPPRETLVATSPRPNFKALAMRVVLAHSHVTFHPYTCGLRRCAVTIAAALISYDEIKVAAETTTMKR
jgi:hypothetical protein